MIYFIKIIIFLLISHYSHANNEITNKIIFKLNNKAFTNIDLENRKDYIGFINNLIPSNFSQSENIEILDDYISVLIFYEYYIQNDIFFKNLNDEIDSIYKKFYKNNEQLRKININNFKFNTKIDLVRKKIIEQKLNFEKESLLKNKTEHDLLYNYNLKYLIIKEDLIDYKLINNIDNINEFNKFKNLLIKNKVDFFYKEEDINNKTIISNKIKNIIDQNIHIKTSVENGYVSVISINKNLKSFDGVFVKLINFTSNKLFDKLDLQCDKLNQNIDISKTFFKEYEYSKLNSNIKNNLKSINDHILIKEGNKYNYIILCDLSYDEKILKNIIFNKDVNFLIDKIEKQFLKNYKNEYKFIKVK